MTIRYNVRDAAGKMHYGVAEAGKTRLVAAGGKVVNKITSPSKTRRKKTETRKKKTASSFSDKTVDELVREARVKGVEASLKEQMRLWAEGKIGKEEFQRRKAALEEAHLEWARGAEARGWKASEEEREEAESIVREVKVKQTEEQIKQVLGMEARGEITHEQAAAAVKAVEEEHLEWAKEAEKGEPPVPKGLELVAGYQFVEAPPKKQYVVTYTEHGEEKKQVFASEERAQAFIEHLERKEAQRRAAIPVAAVTAFKHRQELESQAEMKSLEEAAKAWQPIPGPAAGPAPGSLGEKLMKAFEAEEKAVTGFTGEMREAGRTLGAEAQQALKEGDVREALAKGMAAFSARAGVGIVESATFPFRPVAWKKAAVGLGTMAFSAATEPEEIPGKVGTWARNVARDPGAIVEFGFDVATDVGVGMAAGMVAEKVLGKGKAISRLEEVKVDVESPTLKLVKEGEELTGAPRRAVQVPEAEIKATARAEKNIPRAAAEIIEPELDDLKGPAKIAGVKKEGAVTSLEKIEVPEGSLDDLLRGKRVEVEGAVETEIVDIGSRSAKAVEEVADPFTGTRTFIPKEKPMMPLEAKELGPRIEVLESAPKTGKLVFKKGGKFLDDVLEVVPPPEKAAFKVEFGGPWFDEPVGWKVLEAGEHVYDVKGAIVDLSEKAKKAADDFELKPLEPGPGPKTPLSKTFGKDVTQAEKAIVKELTEGMVPVAKVVSKPIDLTAPAAAAGAVTAAAAGLTVEPAKGEVRPEATLRAETGALEVEVALGASAAFETAAEAKPVAAPLLDGMEVATPPVEVPPITRLKPKPASSLVDIPVQGTVISPGIIPIPRPTPVTETPSIEKLRSRPAMDVITISQSKVEPLFDLTERQTQALIPAVRLRQRHKTPMPLIPQFPPPAAPPPGLPLFGRPTRRRRRREEPPLLGWERRRYPVPSPAELLGLGPTRRTRRKRKPARRRKR